MAGAGVLAFIGFGVVAIPGLVKHQRAPHDESVAANPKAGTLGTPYTASERQDESRVPAKSSSPIPFTDLGLRDFDCMVTPNEVVEIGSSITGLIDEILVERSELIEAGQVVVRLESGVEEAAVRLAKARAQRQVEIESSAVSLAFQMKRIDRARNLFAQESLSVDGRDQVETEALLASLDLERAKEDNRIFALQLEQAEAALSRHTIHSPIDGVVVDRLMAPGEVVDEETILRIAEIDPLRVEVILPASMFGKVDRGDDAEVFVESGLERTLRAKVTIVDRIIDGPSGTFGASLLLPNPDHALPAGIRCHVRFVEQDDTDVAAASDGRESGPRPKSASELAVVE